MSDSLSISELATTVGMTARNIRSHQSRGLMHSPRIEGRTARYGSDHVVRLELITSLQREGFTLAAIKRLIDTPNSYASIVADRRRSFRDGTSDIAPTVPVPIELIEQLLCELPPLPDDLTDTGLVWLQDGQLVTHVMLMGVGRTLAAQGLPPRLIAQLMLDAAGVARSLAELFSAHVERQDRDDQRNGDLAKVAVQLSAAAFEIAFLGAVRRLAGPDRGGPTAI